MFFISRTKANNVDSFLFSSMDDVSLSNFKMGKELVPRGANFFLLE